MSARTSEKLRGGQFVAHGGDVIADFIDRHRPIGLKANCERDWSDPAGAAEQAARIAAFWRDKTLPGAAAVITHVERIATFGGISCVRSNLRNGLPPR